MGNRKMKDNYKKILEHFDSIFETNTKKEIKDLPLFNVFYEYFADDFYTPTEETKKLMKERRIVSDELEKTFTEEQKTLFEKYWDLDSQITEDLRKQLFLFGYMTATEIFKETDMSQTTTENTRMTQNKKTD